MRTLLLNSLVVFLIAAGGVPLIAIQSIRTVVTVQQELASFAKMPIAAKIAKVRADPSATHLVLQLLDDLDTFTLTVADLLSNPDESDPTSKLSLGDVHYFRAVMRGAINEIDKVSKEMQERKRIYDEVDYSGEDH